MTLWSDERIADLREQCASPERPSASAMAERYGITRNAVIGKVKRLGLLLPNHGSYNSHSGIRPRKSPERKTRFYAPPTQPEAVPEPIDPPIPFDGKGVTLFELEPWSCRWPIGDPGHPDFSFCGSMSIAGFPYCRSHGRIAYRPQERRRA